MADIIVTTPRRLHRAAKAEALRARRMIRDHPDSIIMYVRSLSARPSRLRHGDRVYYIDEGYLTGYAIASEIWGRDNPHEPGKPVVTMRVKSWVWIKPIPMTGFQGFRYAPNWLRDDVEVVGDWLADKPPIENR